MDKWERMQEEFRRSLPGILGGSDPHRPLDAEIYPRPEAHADRREANMKVYVLCLDYGPEGLRICGATTHKREAWIWCAGDSHVAVETDTDELPLGDRNHLLPGNFSEDNAV